MLASGSLEEEPELRFCLERGAQVEQQIEGDLPYLQGDALGSNLGSDPGVSPLAHLPYSRPAHRRREARGTPQRNCVGQLLGDGRGPGFGGGAPGRGSGGWGFPPLPPGAQTRSGKKGVSKFRS